MRALALPLALALCAVPAVAVAFPVTVVQQAGPTTQRFNVAILGDGYRASDQAKLTSDAKALVSAIFDGAPYKPYRQLFNFKVIQSVSTDQGATGGSAGGNPNTLFGAYFNCSGVAQLVCVNQGAVLAAALADVPEFDLAMVVVNDDKYGGAGGNVPVVSTNVGAPEILRHELGHNLANLADEYDFAYPGYPACSPVNDCTEPNATLRNVRSQIKWLDWLEASTPVPTAEGQNFAGVGVFEGARYLATGLYRPVDTGCKMQLLGKGFCPVCSEALVRSFWNLTHVHLIDEALPAGDVQSTSCKDTQFSVKTPVLDGATLSFSWTIDGQLQPAAAASLVVASGALAAGQHSVVVTVKDTSALVRHDPEGMLSETHTFKYGVPDCKPDASSPMDAGVAGGGVGGAGVAGAGASAGAPQAPLDAGSHGGAPGSAGASAGAAAVAGAGLASAGSAPIAPPPAERVGCNCRTGDERAADHPWGFVALLGLASLARRRPREAQR